MVTRTKLKRWIILNKVMLHVCPARLVEFATIKLKAPETIGVMWIKMIMFDLSHAL